MAGSIELKDLSKHYKTPDGIVPALDRINLKIPEGSVFGIIGMSGAGKSTLVRCINLLERPDEGSVIVGETDLTGLKDRDLRAQRKRIGMIFQHFNLLMQKNILDNIAFPLTATGTPKKAAREKAKELLKRVGLEEKARSYPATLSGGQKQRVAIARALAQNPEILLCDEATSALDPETTDSILDLLKEINRELGITIIIITHEMSVVRKICDSVAILSDGHIVETGSVLDIFSRPETEEAKGLIFRDHERNSEPEEDREDDQAEFKGKKYRIVYTGENKPEESVIANLILKFRVPVNILYADTKEVLGKARGHMIVRFPKDNEETEQMLNYLEDSGLFVEEVT